MASNKRLRAVTSQQGDKTTTSHNLTLREASLLGISSEKDAERPYVNLKYYWPDHECFSVWEAAKLKAFSGFCRKLTQMRWNDIYATGGGLGNKTGLGYTVHKNHDVLPTNPDLSSLSPDLTWFELRIDGDSRVHGFRARDAFFLVFLDQGHAVYKS
ncbi:hypothetical protein [Sphingorhabdus sp.]|jgi:hypothetical protein|uniref:hypothetical protein n=1 Tax=Sphingorhabdus sp. TaxID=1902408 RepID=UPI0037CAE141